TLLCPAARAAVGAGARWAELAAVRLTINLGLVSLTAILTIPASNFTALPACTNTGTILTTPLIDAEIKSATAGVPTLGCRGLVWDVNAVCE
ncbi:hypothetical protein KBC79_06615, partial [Candidatus Woesebacteria bacterium]|nr:hypothetical protein [Candidatus Woesebacteria bacterium]